MRNNKSLGQHWLKNREILDEIADLASVSADDRTVCLEIGPGLGTLTSSLLKRFTKVIAVEFDERLATNLPKSFPGKNLQVVQGDILSIDVPELIGGTNYAVVGNIPYYITSPIVRKMIELSPAPQRIVLLMQKEVAERIAGHPGNHSLLSLTVQNRAEVTLGPVVPASEFTPPPKVDSQVISLEPFAEPVISETAIRLATAGFASPRKKLIHNLANLRGSKEEWRKCLEDLEISPDVRAEDLALTEWAKLVEKSACIL